MAPRVCLSVYLCLSLSLPLSQTHGRKGNKREETKAGKHTHLRKKKKDWRKRGIWWGSRKEGRREWRKCQRRAKDMEITLPSPPLPHTHTEREGERDGERALNLHIYITRKKIITTTTTTVRSSPHTHLHHHHHSRQLTCFISPQKTWRRNRRRGRRRKLKTRRPITVRQLLPHRRQRV